MSMGAALPRLLSPMRRRIYPNALTGTHIHGEAPMVRSQREACAEGEPDLVTWSALKKMGWVEYDGPGLTDERGYIIPGTDPEVRR